MHPAPSLILFTVLSGFGFGLLAFLGAGWPAPVGLPAFILYGAGHGLAGAGLIAAAFHLGHPERALLAFTQWRSSWLSREAVLSAATLAVMAPHAAGAGLAVATITSTAMIYAQIRAVPRWSNWTTPAVFLAAGLAGGALLAGHMWLSGWLMIVLGAALTVHWQTGDRRFAEAGSTPETATGLGRIGRVRLFESPHTGSNYLLKEMVHQVGRRHAQRLRLIALAAGALGPAVLLLLLPASWLLLVLVLPLHLVGILAARWLFFAEAEHAVGLYYGRAARAA